VLVHPDLVHGRTAPIPESRRRKTTLDNITLYWLTNTAARPRGLYWENGARGSVIVAAARKTAEISAPGRDHGVSGRTSIDPGDMGPARLSQPDLLHEVDRGGHCGVEQPELFAPELRAAFRSLRGWLIASTTILTHGFTCTSLKPKGSTR
jgi:hypothetical protein